MLDGVGVGISVDMTYETPGSTHENIGCTAKGVTYVASCLTTPVVCLRLWVWIVSSLPPLLCPCVCASGLNSLAQRRPLSSLRS